MENANSWIEVCEAGGGCGLGMAYLLDPNYDFGDRLTSHLINLDASKELGDEEPFWHDDGDLDPSTLDWAKRKNPAFLNHQPIDKKKEIVLYSAERSLVIGIDEKCILNWSNCGFGIIFPSDEEIEDDPEEYSETYPEKKKFQEFRKLFIEYSKLWRHDYSDENVVREWRIRRLPDTRPNLEENMQMYREEIEQRKKDDEMWRKDEERTKQEIETFINRKIAAGEWHSGPHPSYESWYLYSRMTLEKQEKENKRLIDKSKETEGEIKCPSDSSCFDDDY